MKKNCVECSWSRESIGRKARDPEALMCACPDVTARQHGLTPYCSIERLMGIVCGADAKKFKALVNSPDCQKQKLPDSMNPKGENDAGRFQSGNDSGATRK